MAMTGAQGMEEKRKRIVEALLDYIKKNPKEWSEGWSVVSNQAPYNGKTKKPYHGANMIYLSILARQSGYTDPRWVTFQQAKELGASVKKGEHGGDIFYWSLYDRKTKCPYSEETCKNMTERERDTYRSENVVHVIRYYKVFNAEQCVNMPAVEGGAVRMPEEERLRQNALIEQIITNSAAPISYDGGNSSYYAIETDSIHLPRIERFKSMQDYYATALHEIAHSTGHQSRLNRSTLQSEKPVDCAKEELRAELAGIFLQMEYGISIEGSHFENHGAYLADWMEELEKNPQEFFSASTDAEKITKYILEHYAQQTKENDTEQIRDSETADKAMKNSAKNVRERVEQSALKSRTEDNVPEAMRVQSRWCAFKAERDEDGKTIKRLFDCNQSAPPERQPKYLKWAKSTDPETWATYEDAKKFAKLHNLDGVAFALGGSGITCIDLDHSIDAQGNVSPFARKIMETAGDTYTERSVSGRGIHVFYAGSAPENRLNRNDKIDLEVYDDKRFMCVTGDRMNESQAEVLPPTQELTDLLKENLSKVVEYMPQKASLSLSDSELIEKIRGSKKGDEFDRLWAGEDVRGNRSVSDMTLCNMLAFFSGGDAEQVERVFRASGMYRQAKGDAYVRRTAQKACATLTKIYDPSSYRSLTTMQRARGK